MEQTGSDKTQTGIDETQTGSDETFGLISKEEYARVVGRLTELWYKHGSKGTNMDILNDIIRSEDLPVASRVYAGFIHGIEVMRLEQVKKERSSD